MKHRLTCLFFIFFTFPALAHERPLHIVYQDFDFYVPENPTTIGYLGTENNILIAKYSDKPGEKVIGFSVENDMNTAGCKPDQFFASATNEVGVDCDKSSMEAFRHVFVDNREVGAWNGEEYNFYYFVADNMSTVFVTGDEPASIILKIDSNFLTRQQIKQVVTKYLQ